MIKIAFINENTGLVSFIAIPADDSLYKEGIKYGESVARHIPFDSDDTIVLETWHWNGFEFKTHLPQKGQYEIWDKETFSYKLDKELLFKTKENEVKIERQQLLISTDWTDTVSAQTRLSNYAEWQTYRQALRDIPSQSGYPFNVIWPEQPQ